MSTMTSFDSIPDEIVVRILEFLPFEFVANRIPLVNSRFRRLSRDPSLWTKLEFRLSRGHFIEDEEDFADWLRNTTLPRCTLLKELRIHNMDKINRLGESALDLCGKIRVLALTLTGESPGEGLIRAVGRHKNLRQFYCDQKGVKKDVLMRNAECFSRLTHLSIPYSVELDDECVISVVDNCRSLRHLDLTEVNRISDRAAKKIFTDLGPNLDFLVLDGEHLTDASLHMIANCVNLRSFAVFFAENVGSTTLKAISKLSRLRELTLRRGKSLSGDEFANAFCNEQLKHLRKLDLAECNELNDEALLVIAANCPELGHVCLNWCWELSDRSIEALIRTLYKAQEVFGVAVTSIELVGIVHLTSDPMENMPLFLPELRLLDLTQCSQIDDTRLLKLAKRAGKKLRVLDYYGRNMLEDEENENASVILAEDDQL